MMDPFGEWTDSETSRFIREVEKKPALWDLNIFSYNVVLERAKIWEDIAKALMKDKWSELSETEKAAASTQLKKKWTRLRAAFSRTSPALRSPQRAKNKRNRKHWKQLQFLTPFIKTSDSVLKKILQSTGKKQLVDWTHDENLQFLSEVEQRPAIWNRDAYHSKEDREKAWDDVADAMMMEGDWEKLSESEKRFTTEILRKKWRNVRDRFNKNLNSLAISGDKSKKPAYWEELQFLVHLPKAESSTSSDEKVTNTPSFLENAEQPDEIQRKIEQARPNFAFMTTDAILQLISEVKQRPVIWDRSAIGYGGGAAKQSAWESISSSIMTEGKWKERSEAEKKLAILQLRTKWKSLRDRFKKNLNALALIQEKKFEPPSEIDETINEWKKIPFWDELQFLAQGDEENVISKVSAAKPAKEIAKTPAGKGEKARSFLHMSREEISLLICEVKKRPVLWNCETSGFCNRGEKQKAWKSAASFMMAKGAWAKLSEAEKRLALLQLRSKWKNIRDRFKKILNSMTMFPDKHMKKPAHWNELQFLVPNSFKDLSDKSTWSDKLIKEEMDTTEMSEQSLPSPQNAAEAQNFPMDLSESSVDDPSVEPVSQQDEDETFLMSLLPHLKNLRPQFRLETKAEIMLAILRARSYPNVMPNYLVSQNGQNP